MPPPVILLLAALMFSFIYLIIKAKGNFELKKLDKMMAQKEEANSLTTSELESMIEQAVARAVLPMSEKIDAMESRMQALESEAESTDRISLDNLDVETPPQKTLGRMTREQSR